MKYFDKVTDIKELKKQYKQNAFRLHPDRGGDEESFKEMSAEYEELFKRIKAGIKEQTHSKNINLDDVDDGYRAVINLLLHMELDVELCGEWLWISGDTKPVKDQLKAVGCKWATKKKLWYWKPAWMKNRSRKEHDMEWIRSAYGSVHFDKNSGGTDDKKKLGA